MGKINVAIIGIGNCCSSLVQGVTFYKKAKEVNFWGCFFGFLAFLFANTSMAYTDVFTFGLILSFLFYKNYDPDNSI